MNNKIVTGISATQNDSKVSLIGVKDKPGVAAAIFKPLSKNLINVDMVVQNISANGKETDLTFTIKTDDLNKTKKIIQQNKTINYRKLLFEKGVSKISVIGVGMITTPGVTFRMFQSLANKKINIKVISTSEIKISDPNTGLTLSNNNIPYGSFLYVKNKKKIKTKFNSTGKVQITKNSKLKSKIPQRIHGKKSKRKLNGCSNIEGSETETQMSVEYDIDSDNNNGDDDDVDPSILNTKSDKDVNNERGLNGLKDHHRNNENDNDTINNNNNNENSINGTSPGSIPVDQLSILDGVVSAYNDMLSAHAPLKDYPDVIKNSSEKRNAIARVAGGVPAMCDGITQGEPGMELSLFSRDVIALSTAVAFSHNVFDAGICLGVCDKIVPGLVIGALSFGHFPIAMLPAGPMPTGISNEEKSNNRKKYASGEIDRSALISSEQSAYHSSGTCTFYGTANTNQLIMEVMGLQLPSASFFQPSTKERLLLIDKTVECILDLKEKGIKMGEMLDSKSWVNAIVALIASGGSTNLAIHLIAMAEAGGFKITIEDIDEIASVTPIIANVYPNGTADVNEFHNSGGVAAFIGSLLDGYD